MKKLAIFKLIFKGFNCTVIDLCEAAKHKEYNEAQQFCCDSFTHDHNVNIQYEHIKSRDNHDPYLPFSPCSSSGQLAKILQPYGKQTYENKQSGNSAQNHSTLQSYNTPQVRNEFIDCESSSNQNHKLLLPSNDYKGRNEMLDCGAQVNQDDNDLLPYTQALYNNETLYCNASVNHNQSTLTLYDTPHGRHEIIEGNSSCNQSTKSLMPGYNPPPRNELINCGCTINNNHPMLKLYNTPQNRNELVDSDAIIDQSNKSKQPWYKAQYRDEVVDALSNYSHNSIHPCYKALSRDEIVDTLSNQPHNSIQSCYKDQCRDEIIDVDSLSNQNQTPMQRGYNPKGNIELYDCKAAIHKSHKTIHSAEQIQLRHEGNYFNNFCNKKNNRDMSNEQNNREDASPHNYRSYDLGNSDSDSEREDTNGNDVYRKQSGYNICSSIIMYAGPNNNEIATQAQTPSTKMKSYQTLDTNPEKIIEQVRFEDMYPELFTAINVIYPKKAKRALDLGNVTAEQVKSYDNSNKRSKKTIKEVCLPSNELVTLIIDFAKVIIYYRYNLMCFFNNIHSSVRVSNSGEQKDYVCESNLLTRTAGTKTSFPFFLERFTSLLLRLVKYNKTPITIFKKMIQQPESLEDDLKFYKKHRNNKTYKKELSEKKKKVKKYNCSVVMQKKAILEENGLIGILYFLQSTIRKGSNFYKHCDMIFTMASTLNTFSVYFEKNLKNKFQTHMNSPLIETVLSASTSTTSSFFLVWAIECMFSLFNNNSIINLINTGYTLSYQVDFSPDSSLVNSIVLIYCAINNNDRNCFNLYLVNDKKIRNWKVNISKALSKTVTIYRNHTTFDFLMYKLYYGAKDSFYMSKDYVLGRSCCLEILKSFDDNVAFTDKLIPIITTIFTKFYVLTEEAKEQDIK